MRTTSSSGHRRRPSSSAEKDFYGARVSEAGTVLDPDGFAVCTVTGIQTTLNADCTAGPGGATALAWTDARTGLTSLYWTTVSSGGAVLDGSPSSGRLVFQDISFPPGYPSITYNGRDYVVFYASRSRVIASLVGTDGTIRPLQRVPVSYGANPTRTACAYDGANYLISWVASSTSQVFAQLVTDANQVPIAEAGPGGTFEATRGIGVLDGSLSTDPDGDLPLAYSWTMVSKPATGSPALTNWFAQQTSFNTSTPGQYVYELTVTDAHGAVGLPDRVSFTVTPFTNRPPILDPIGPRTVTELQPLIIHLSGSDPDGDLIEFGVTSLPPGAVFDKATATFTWTPTATQARIYYIQFWIRDSAPLTTKETVTITVLDANRPPVLTAVDDRTVYEGQLLEISLSGTDPDGTALTYSATGIPAGATLNPSTGQFTWTPGYDRAGDYPVTFSVSDGTTSDTENIVIHVLDRDITPPVITVPATSVPDADGRVVVGVGDAVLATYTIDGVPAGSLAPSGGVISIPGSAFEATGTYTVTVTATDAGGNSAMSPAFTVTVDRTPPTISPSATRVTLTSGASVTVSVGDAASATYQIGNGDVMPAEIADQSISVPGPTAEGTYTVHVTATDAAGNEGRCSFEVVIPHLNRAPALETVGDRRVNEGQLVGIPLAGTDPDAGDPLTFSASNLPEGAAFDPVTRIFTWTPTFAQAGTYPGVRFEVTDRSLSAYEAITITVTDVNRPPELDAIGPMSVDEGQLLSFSLTGSDPDGDTLTYATGDLPDGATFSTETRTFSWTPTFAQDGDYRIAFSVSDGTVSVLEEIVVHVADRDITPPTITVPIAPRPDADGTVAVGIGDAVSATYSIDSGPDVSLTPEDGSIRVPVPIAPGACSVTVRATDAAGNTATSSFTVTIADTASPVIAAPASTTAVPDAGFVVSATDNSGTAIVAYTVSVGGRNVASGSMPGSVTIPAHVFQNTGVYTVEVTATDAAHNTATSTFTVSIDATAPDVATPAAVPNPAPLGTAITVTAGLGDTGAFSSGIASASCALDDGPWLPMTAGDATFGGTTETVTATLPAFASAGVHSIRVRGTDAAGNAAAESDPLLLAVYDPSAGFVTGGGWIGSPAGAYAADPSVTGKATFGFVSKYQKGAKRAHGRDRVPVQDGRPQLPLRDLRVAGRGRREGAVQGQRHHQRPGRLRLHADRRGRRGQRRRWDGQVPDQDLGPADGRRGLRQPDECRRHGRPDDRPGRRVDHHTHDEVRLRHIPLFQSPCRQGLDACARKNANVTATATNT